MILDSLSEFLKENIVIFHEIEDSLISYEISQELISLIMNDLLKKLYISKIQNLNNLSYNINNIIKDKITSYVLDIEIKSSLSPHIIFVSGLNGTGKSSSCLKMCNTLCFYGWNTGILILDYTKAGSRDQFIESLDHKVKILNEEIINNVHKSILASKSSLSGLDVIIVDTGGRNALNLDLMLKLKKIKTSIKSVYPNSVFNSVFPLDLTLGSEALENLDVFAKIIGVDGLIATKTDVNDKHGIILSACHRFNMPIYGVISHKDEYISSLDFNKFTADIMKPIDAIIKKYSRNI